MWSYVMSVDGVKMCTKDFEIMLKTLHYLGNRAQLLRVVPEGQEGLVEMPKKMAKKVKVKRTRKVQKGKKVRVRCSFCGKGFLALATRVANNHKKRDGRIYCSRSHAAMHEWERMTPTQKKKKVKELQKGR